MEFSETCFLKTIQTVTMCLCVDRSIFRVQWPTLAPHVLSPNSYLLCFNIIRLLKWNGKCEKYSRAVTHCDNVNASFLHRCV